MRDASVDPATGRPRPKTTTAGRRLRVVKGRPSETPLLDLAAGVRIYHRLAEQRQALDGTMEELRDEILSAMERSGIDDFYTEGLHVERQERHYPPEMDEAAAVAILRREGRLRQVQTALDPEKARRALTRLVEQGRIKPEELPFREPRTVAALVVRDAEP